MNFRIIKKNNNNGKTKIISIYKLAKILTKEEVNILVKDKKIKKDKHTFTVEFIEKIVITLKRKPK